MNLAPGQEGRQWRQPKHTFFGFAAPPDLLPYVVAYSSSHTVGSWLIMLNSFSLRNA